VARWGPALRERPYLWLYAELVPEHLNEIGSTWLAERVASSIAQDVPDAQDLQDVPDAQDAQDAPDASPSR
jgi:hypothetical protein